MSRLNQDPIFAKSEYACEKTLTPSACGAKGIFFGVPARKESEKRIANLPREALKWKEKREVTYENRFEFGDFLYERLFDIPQGRLAPS
ncbi:MAG: hypothetical protein J6Y74_03480 [Clostridia bacterium]|nr:hypothetical protein [Clostridia bacterium]